MQGRPAPAPTPWATGGASRAPGVPGEAAAPRTPSALALWWGRTKESVGSDLALHGLAYLGVLLFFVGGGLLLPVMVVTTFLDDVAVPPDLEGTPLVLALTVLTSLVSVAYAAWSHRHPDSALRFLVARWRGSRSRWPPSAIAALSVLTWVAEGWPFIAVLVTGVLVLVALELLADRMPAATLGVAEPLWWGLVSVALARGGSDLSLDAGAVAAVSATGFLTLLEVAGAARRPNPALALPALGLLAALLATMNDLWWAVAAFGHATAWAGWRRMAPWPVRGAAGILDVATATLPVVALLNLAAASDVPSALLTVSIPTSIAPSPNATARSRSHRPRRIGSQWRRHVRRPAASGTGTPCGGPRSSLGIGTPRAHLRVRWRTRKSRILGVELR